MAQELGAPVVEQLGSATAWMGWCAPAEELGTPTAGGVSSTAAVEEGGFTPGCSAVATAEERGAPAACDVRSTTAADMGSSSCPSRCYPRARSDRGGLEMSHCGG